MDLLIEYLRQDHRLHADALHALREVLLLADNVGTVQRSDVSDRAAGGVHRLAEVGLLEIVGSTGTESPTGPEPPSWSQVRLTPAVMAELAVIGNDGDRERLFEAIDARLDEVPDTHPTDVGTGAPESPAAANGGEVIVPLDHDAPYRTIETDTDGGITEDHPQAVLAPAATAGPVSTLASRGLVKIYRKRRVVNEVDLYLRQGEIVGLLGPNGAGKTTTFYMVVGLIKPDRGKVYLGDEDVTNVPMFRRARRGIGYLSQEPSVFRKLTVEENIRAILQMLGLPRREQRERLERLLDELGIKELRHAKAYTLSGGERRRLEITRALVGNPKFMLLDEPFAGVDPIAVHDIQQIVADLRRRGIGVLISDHNVEQTLDIVDRAYIMYDGRVRVSGTVSELVWNDEVAEIYLGPTLTARMRQRYTQPL
jgi:LPS export ABC transporter ATP-binding protein